MATRAGAAVRQARWTVFVILGLFVVLIAVPSGAKPWVLATMALGVVVLLACLGALWLARDRTHRLSLSLAGLFAVGLLASILYLRSLPDAAIPIVGVPAMFICLVGLAATGLSANPYVVRGTS